MINIERDSRTFIMKQQILKTEMAKHLFFFSFFFFSFFFFFFASYPSSFFSTYCCYLSLSFSLFMMSGKARQLSEEAQ